MSDSSNTRLDARIEAAELDAIESLVEHTTPGPWAYLSCGEKDNSWQVGLWSRPDGTSVRGEVADDDAERYEAAGFPDDWSDEQYSSCEDTICENHASMANLSDAAFIAEAREWVPALVAEVRRLRAERPAVERLAAALEGLLVWSDLIMGEMNAILGPEYAREEIAPKVARAALAEIRARWGHEDEETG